MRHLRLGDQLSRGWALVVGGSGARLALGLLTSVIIARALGPATFGAYVLLGTAATLAGVAADLGLSAAAVRPIARHWEDDALRAGAVARAFLWLRMLAAGLCALAGALLAGWLGPWFGVAPLAVGLASLGIWTTALSSTIATLLQSIGRFGRLALVPLANAGLTLVLALLLALGGVLTLEMALLALGILPALAAIWLGLRMLPEGWSLRWPGWTALAGEGRPLLRFGRWLWISQLLAYLAGSLDVLLVARWGGALEVGLYALALNLASKVGIVNAGLYTVLHTGASTLRDERAVAAYLRQGLRRGAVASAGLALLLPLAGPLIGLVYGVAYAPAAPLLSGLVGVAIFDLFATPLALLLYASERPGLLAASDGLRAALLLLGAWLIPGYGLAGAILAKLIGRIAGAALVLVALWRRPPFPAAEEQRSCASG